jgi:hypothetical protein
MSTNWRRIKLEGVNLGDGKPSKVWFEVHPQWVQVRRYRHKEGWRMSAKEAAGVIARRVQVQQT